MNGINTFCLNFVNVCVCMCVRVLKLKIFVYIFIRKPNLLTTSI